MVVNMKMSVDLSRDFRSLFLPQRSSISTYSSPNIISLIKSRRMRWVGHVARLGEERKLYRVLVGRPKGKRPHGKQRRRWKDEIRMEIRWGGGMDSVGSG
jgi:hypothetical protein